MLGNRIEVDVGPTSEGASALFSKDALYELLSQLVLDQKENLPSCTTLSELGLCLLNVELRLFYLEKHRGRRLSRILIG